MKNILIETKNELSVKSAINSNKYYVYVHKDSSNNIIYVGSGKKYRCINIRYNKSWMLLYNKEDLYVEIYKSNLLEQDARIIEKELILKIGIENLTNEIIFNEENLSKNNKGEFNGNYGNTGANNPISIKVVCLNKEGKFIKQYDSIKETEKDGFIPPIVCACCNKYENRKSHKEHIFMFLSDYDISKSYKLEQSITHERKVLQFTKDNILVKTFDSINSTRKDGFNPTNVQQVCKGSKKSHRGFIFKYKSI